MLKTAGFSSKAVFINRLGFRRTYAIKLKNEKRAVHTKKQLIQEVAQLQERIIDLEARVKDCGQLEASLREREKRFRFMAKATGLF